MPQGNVSVSGYRRRTSTGKVVNVSRYVQKRDLSDLFAALGRVGSVSAQPGQMPGGRSIPIPPKNSKVARLQTDAQRRNIAQLRKQVSELRRTADPAVAAAVPSTKDRAKGTYASKKAKGDRKSAKEKQIKAAEKLQTTRGADEDKLQEASNLLKSVAAKQETHKRAAEKRAATKQAAIDEMVGWIDSHAEEIDAHGINVDEALKSVSISREQLSNPDTPRTRVVSQEEFDALWERGRQRIAEFQQESSAPVGLDENWDAIKQEAFAAVQEEWGGMTMNTHTGEALEGDEDLFALTVKDTGQQSVTVPIGATPEEFDQAMERARQEFSAQFERQQHYLGVFHNVDTGNIEIDPVLVVDNLDDVETIGAYTHAVGGAYRFSDGLGYWPPYVGDSSEEQQGIREVAPAGESGAAGAGDNQAGQAGGGNVAGREDGARQGDSPQAQVLTFSKGEITPEEKASLSDYTDPVTGAYDFLNSHLRGTRPHSFREDNSSPSKEELDAMQANLDSLIEKSPLDSDRILFRGFDFEKWTDTHEVGATITDDGFVSASGNLQIALGFKRNLLRIEAPAGFPAADVDSTDVGFGEQEFLFPRGTQFRVIAGPRKLETQEFTGVYVSDTSKERARVLTVEPILPDRYEGYEIGANNGGTAQGSQQALPEGQAGQASGQASNASAGATGENDLEAGGLQSSSAEEKLTSLELFQLKTAFGNWDKPGVQDAAQKNFQRIYSGTFAGLGVTLEGEPYTSSYDDGAVTQDFSINLPDGLQVGRARRAFTSDGRAIHISLSLDEHVQGQGFATAFNKAAEEKYRQMGVKEIALSTDEVGGYAWARAGYDWDSTRDNSYTSMVVDEILDRISDAAEELYGEQNPQLFDVIRKQLQDLREQVMRFADNPAADMSWLPTPFELSQIGYHPGDENWAGKQGMIGSNWDGVKYLD